MLKLPYRKNFVEEKYPPTLVKDNPKTFNFKSLRDIKF